MNPTIAAVLMCLIATYMILLGTSVALRARAAAIGRVPDGGAG